MDRLNKLLSTCDLYGEKVMNKFLAVLSITLALMSFQANAATLDWIRTPPKGLATGSGTHELDGDYGSNLTLGKVGGNWKFSVGDLSTVVIDVKELSDQILDLVVTLDKVELSFANGDWSFIGTLTPGNHVLMVKGRANSPGANIDIDISAVPIPAAIWLFGSVLVSMIGFSLRRAV
jgi:hypothetical protein